MNIEREIIEYLSLHGAVRTTELIDALRELHKVGRGFSRETLYRRLKRMLDSGTIRRLTHDEIVSFGYPDTDGRAEYIDLALSLERKTHIDSIIEGLGKNDLIYKKTALKDLIRYKEKYRLSPQQLDEIVKILQEDPEIAANGLHILRSFVYGGIYPGNKNVFIQQLHEILDVFCRSTGFDNKMKENALFLLSANDDYRVIESLKDDINRIRNQADSESFVGFYLRVGAAPIIEKNRSELFNFECDLRRENNDIPADAVADIRTSAFFEVEKNFKKTMG
jgi:DNA-binding Lrp family transcriptional regulator